MRNQLNAKAYVATLSIMIAVPLIMIIGTPVALADVQTAEHGGGSVCYNCHVANYTTTSNAASLHNMTSGLAWETCASAAACHANTNASGTVHDVVDCKGCHSPLHVSANTNGTGAWLFVYRLNNSGVIAYKPTLPLTWNKTVLYYDNTNDTSALGQSFSTWGGEIHWAWTNVSGVASGISSATRYLVCMNCHFLTTNPAEAGLSRMIQGRTMIAIPDFTLQLPPHSITESALREAASGSGRLVEFKSDDLRNIGGAIAGIALIGGVLWRRRSAS